VATGIFRESGLGNLRREPPRLPPGNHGIVAATGNPHRAADPPRRLPEVEAAKAGKHSAENMSGRLPASQSPKATSRRVTGSREHPVRIQTSPEKLGRPKPARLATAATLADPEAASARAVKPPSDQPTRITGREPTIARIAVAVRRTYSSGVISAAVVPAANDPAA